MYGVSLLLRSMAAVIDNIFGLLNDCCSPPHEQFEFFNFMPLYLAPSEELWSEISSEADDYDEEEAMIERPKIQQSLLEQKFLEVSEGRPKLESKKTIRFAQQSGFAPSKSEERQLIEKNPEGLDVKQVQKWMDDIRHAEDTPSHLKSFLRRYDPDNTGKIQRRTLKTLLTMQGGEEALTIEEFEATLK